MAATGNEHVASHTRRRWLGRAAGRVATGVRRSGWAIPALASKSMNAYAATDSQAPAETRDSPWLIAPIFSSDPKLGASLGALAAYLHKFDPVSSVFGAGGLYTSTYSKDWGF